MSAATVDHDMGVRFGVFSDPAIKLFGRDIPLASPTSIEATKHISGQDIEADMLQTEECNELMDAIPSESGASASVDDGTEAVGSLSAKKQAEDIPIVMATAEEPQANPSAVSIEKVPKRPDKLIPCPRCKSLDTKFCYFNNYNVNQPRHFCRKCQRYWTAGGTLRNVPVGAGRRKHKHSISHQKHAVVSDAVPVRAISMDPAHHRCSVLVRASSADAAHHRSSEGAGLSSPSKPRLHARHLDTTPTGPGKDSPSSTSTILSFGQESPLGKNMAAATLTIGECRAMQNAHKRLDTSTMVSADATGFSRWSSELEALPGKTTDSYTSGQQDVVSAGLQKGGSITCPTSGSPTVYSPAGAMAPREGELQVNAGGDAHSTQVSGAGNSLHGGVWQLGGPNMMLNTPFNTAAATTTACVSENGSTDIPSVSHTNMPPCNGAQGGFWAGFPWPMMNPAMWGLHPLEWASPWNPPFCPTVAAATAAAAAAAALFPFPCAGSAYDKPQQREVSQPEKCLWVPKTLRIDDPLDAARSSIWATLGLGDGPSATKGQTRAFGAVKVERKDDDDEANSSRQQHVNPAASSRSAAFHENN